MSTSGLPCDDDSLDGDNDPFFPPPPPGADIAGALAATEAAVERLTDFRAFELAAIELIQDAEPSVRFVGGSGDRARDGAGGPLRSTDDGIVASVSLEDGWDDKLTREFGRIAEFGWAPTVVLGVTSRRTTPKRRTAVESAAAERGWTVKIFDRMWVAQRLLAPQHLALRERLLGLPPPRPPVAVDADRYAGDLHGGDSYPALIGRETLCASVADAMQRGGLLTLVGVGGIGKSRLVVEAGQQVAAQRVLFIDDRTALDADMLASELAGADRLALVIDNAHRRDDLRQVIGLAERRTGPLTLILVSRPGFDDQLASALEGARSGPLTAANTLRVPPLDGSQITELVRSAKPPLTFGGAIEQITAIADGNPQIALLGHRAAVAGQPVADFGRDELLSTHVESLVHATTVRRRHADGRDVRALLAFVSAVQTYDARDSDVTSFACDLLSLDSRALERLAHDVADGGLLTGSGSKYAIKPDLLSEHLLWASFFAEHPSAELRYEELWQMLWPSLADRLCAALGGLPGGALEPHHSVGTVIAATLIAHARAHPGHALRLARDLMPGCPRIAELVVDQALEHLPDEPPARERALLVAGEALDRNASFDAGYRRLLYVGELLWATSPSKEAAKAMVERLGHVYERVPSDTGPRDGHILAEVQQALVHLVEGTWAMRGDRPGAAEAVAAATRVMLSVTCESSRMSVEDGRQVLLRTSVLPASSYTRAVLEAGTCLFTQTLPRLSPRGALAQLEALWDLRRAADRRGRSGRIDVPEDLAAVSREILDALRSEIERIGPHLSPLVRAAATDTFGPLWPDDEILAEHRRLFGAESRDHRGGWNTLRPGPGVSDRAREEASALLAADQPEAVLHRWSSWVTEAIDAEAGPYRSVRRAGLVLEAAAERDPALMAALLRTLAEEDSPLLDAADGALRVCARTEADAALASDLAAHRHAAARACAARALSTVEGDGARKVLERLGADDDRRVRETATRIYNYSRRDPWRLTAALRACLPDDLHSLAAVLDLASGEHPDPDATVALDGEDLDTARQVALASATTAHPSAPELAEVFRRLRQADAGLASEWAWERIDWIGTLEDADLDAIIRAPQPFADDLKASIAAAATDEDRRRGLALVESRPPMLVGAAARDLLDIVDRGDALVTDRLLDWLRAGDSELRYEAHRALEHTVPWEAFTARVRTLLAGGAIDIVDDLAAARESHVIITSLSEHYAQRRDEFARWLDPDPRLVAAGRQLVAELDRLVTLAEAGESAAGALP